MTEESLVSNSEDVNEELPIPKFTEPSSDSPTSEKKDDLEERLAKRLESHLEKLVQSTKDKRLSEFDNLKRAAGGFDALVAQLKSHGVEVPDKVINEVTRDEELSSLRRRMDELATSRTSPGKAEEQGTELWKQVMEETGLSDQVQIALLAQRASRGEFRNQDHLMREAHRLSKSPASPPVSDAEGVPRPGQPKGRLSDSDVSKISDSIISLSKNYTKNKVEIGRLEKQLKDSGG